MRRRKDNEATPSVPHFIKELGAHPFGCETADTLPRPAGVVDLEALPILVSVVGRMDSK